MKIDDIKRQPILLMFAVIIVIILLVGIFRTIAPYLSLGFGAYAHIGDVRGAISFETFENEGEVVIFSRPGCPFCDQLNDELSKEESKQYGFGIDDDKNLMIPAGLRIVDTSIQGDLVPEFIIKDKGVPSIIFFKTILTAENKDSFVDSEGKPTYIEFTGGRNAAEIKDFLDKKKGTAASAS